MSTKRRTFASAALMLAVALALAALLAPVRALAEPNTVFTATATPSYAHPGTGVIEDSGGEASSALGQSMTESATFPAALVEYDANDTPFVTLRLQLMDHISDVSISADTDWSGNFYSLGYNEMQNTGTTADFQVQEDPSAIFRIQMYVSDMGRYVIFYITLSDLVEGNTQGFVQSVDTSGGAETTTDASGDASGDAAAPAAASPTAATAAAATTAPAATTGAAKSATTGQKVASATAAGTGAAASTADGIQEYDANGNPGGSGASDGTITVPVIGLVTGIVAGLVIGIVAIAIAVGLGIWLYTIRNRNAIERANAALAAASAQAGAQVASATQAAPAARQDAGPDPAADAPAAEDGLDVTSVMPEPRPSKGDRDGLA